MRICHIFISPGHNFFGHHGRPAGRQPIEEVESVECIAGRGLVGDRFFDYKTNYRGQLTLFSWEVFQQLRRNFAPTCDGVSPAALRRNIIVEGTDLNTLVGQGFKLQEVELQGMEECRPCYWMNEVIGEGAEAWLKGRGGLRCRILTTGWLRQDET